MGPPANRSPAAAKKMGARPSVRPGSDATLRAAARAAVAGPVSPVARARKVVSRVSVVASASDAASVHAAPPASSAVRCTSDAGRPAWSYPGDRRRASWAAAASSGADAGAGAPCARPAASAGSRCAAASRPPSTRIVVSNTLTSLPDARRMPPPEVVGGVPAGAAPPPPPTTPSASSPPNWGAVAHATAARASGARPARRRVSSESVRVSPRLNHVDDPLLSGASSSWPHAERVYPFQAQRMASLTAAWRAAGARRQPSAVGGAPGGHASSPSHTPPTVQRTEAS